MGTLSGYTGTMLRVDLTARTIKEEPTDPDTARAFIGGAGYATRVIHDEVPADADPLGPENKLLFMTGPWTATTFPTTARYEVCTKSPLTNMWLATSSAGWWARDFKMTGYDGLIVEGVADSPVYLWIDDGKAEIRDASALWGLDSDQTQEAIRKELGDEKIKVSCIGQAGEMQIPLACIMNDEQRAAGRGGSGAVMGSKKLKAVAVRGTRRVEVADEATVKDAAKAVRAILKDHPVVSQFTPYGTASLMETGWVTGDVPNKNWSEGLWREGCRVPERPAHGRDHPGSPCGLPGLLHPLRALDQDRRWSLRHGGPGTGVRDAGRLRHHGHERQPRSRLLGQRSLQSLRGGHHLHRFGHRLRHGSLSRGASSRKRMPAASSPGAMSTPSSR